MKLLLKTVTWSRKIILYLSFLIALVILVGYDWYRPILPGNLEAFLWKLNSIAIFLVMIIRPLSDLLPSQKWLRSLIPMRKEVGVLSAMIVLSFGLAKYINWGGAYFLETYFSLAYWDITQASFWGRIGELVGVPLLLTSNNWSIKKLKRNWKRIQRLAYVYFFAGAYYVYATFGAVEELWFMAIVIILTLAAYLKKKFKRYQKKRQASA